MGNGVYTFNGKIIRRDDSEYISADKTRLLQLIDAILSQPDIAGLKTRTANLKRIVEALDDELVNTNGEGILLKLKPLLEELQQILDAYTYERAYYYAQRLKKSLTEAKTGRINDINLRRWKDYEEIITDSLWNIDRRDQSGAHLGWYWGNYIPQIPHQLMLRYTRKGDLVVDPFAGSGTTLIECRQLGRHGAGVEINPATVEKARELITAEENPHNVTTRVEAGDSRYFDFKTLIHDMGFDAVDLYLMHPPYHDIIQFTSDPNDLSNAQSTEDFLQMFGAVLDNTLPLLRKGRYVGIVIGDKYSKGEWIPLGFYCMQEAMSRGLKLKSIVVKNFEQTKGKRSQKELWRYRALLGGFYVFKHEYILILEKTR
ncbi:DNA methyltransferase [Desulforudis sp. 1088]|uniref:DNA methyltransferase n=1 Tax=unclassified Candidatus Desulforudis TaxID=2635950 RepID=UPI003CE4AA9C